MPRDRSAEDALMTRMVGEGARKGSSWFGKAGDLVKRPPMWAGLAGVMALCGPRARHAALRGGTCYLTASLIHLPLKVAIGRRHPPGASAHARIGPVLSSFPSGHAAAELAFALTAAQELPALFVPMYAAAAASEWSLLRSRSHYLSDLMAGGALAVAVAYGAWKLWPPPRCRAGATDATAEPAGGSPGTSPVPATAP